MNTRILIILVLGTCLSALALAQTPTNGSWDTEKIKGTRYLPYPAYLGHPFLTDSWESGEITFTNGEKVGNMNLRYSSYKDELLYYNSEISAQIVIDKASLKGFSFTGKDGKLRIFRRLYYDGFLKGDRYFEILSSGEIDLLAYRKVSLNSTTSYKDESGILKNQEYNTDYQYYFYSPKNGYNPVRINAVALLSKFDKTSQPAVKKLLRKNRIRIHGEESFVQAWKVIEKEGHKLIF